MRRRLRRRPMSGHLIIRASRPQCLSELDRLVPPATARLRLDPVLTARRSAQDFVLSHAWGTLPAADGGKVMWAVLDV